MTLLAQYAKPSNPHLASLFVYGLNKQFASFWEETRAQRAEKINHMTESFTYSLSHKAESIPELRFLMVRCMQN